MNNIDVLDCTLRDGGYCNQWNFGVKNIQKVINGLVAANINIIECGFISNNAVYSEGISKYTKMEQLSRFIPKVDVGQLFVAMINYGEFDIDMLPECSNSPLNGIRIAFHKRDIKGGAIEYCRQVKNKGYKLFIQPMVTMNYSDEEFIELIDLVNEIAPYAFYIVDSFGTMRKNTLLHYFELTRLNLDKGIAIGFHSHNNFQSAYSNATSLLEQNCNHKIIIDSSIYGMGRGAGNLNTELLLNELNSEYGMNYLIKPILQLMDEVINHFYIEKPWGYSLPNYLSATHLIHPNYAMYLCEKNTLTVDAMDDIFSMLDRDKATEYDASYIESVYEEYMSKGYVNSGNMDELKNTLKNRAVLLIAPGKSSRLQKDKVVDFASDNNPIIISINHSYEHLKADYIFVSNMRRYRELPENREEKVIATTNIETYDAYMNVDYYSLINSSRTVKDNAGLMAIRLMINMGCEKIFLVGYDGYEYEANENYENRDLELIMSKKQIDELNEGMKLVFDEISEEISIEFITVSRFEAKDRM